MSLHARSVATAAGAVGDEVERVADCITKRGHISLEAAQAELNGLRNR
jgi:hydroxymethylglutaryl-CoA reductase